MLAPIPDTRITDCPTAPTQLFTGEGWHEIMFAAVDATASLSPCVYFIMHHSVVLLLCANLFIGTLPGVRVNVPTASLLSS